MSEPEVAVASAVSTLSQASPTELLVVLLVTAGLALLAGLIIVAVLRTLARRLDVVVLSGRLWQSPVVAIVVVDALRPVVERADRPWTPLAAHVLWLGQVAAIAWLLIVITMTLEKAALAQHPDTGLAAGGSRHIRTKISLLRRVAVAGIVTIAIGICLWSIPEVRTLGLTLLASAGVLGIIAGLAAQTSLANIFAGLQIAFTDGIRVGDIVSFDDTWGRIDEITLTYVSVEAWDGTSLILPCTYFNTTPFRNWTHTGAAVQGTVVLAADWTVDTDALRAELELVLRRSPHWDGERGDLVVDDASGPALRLVAYVSASDGDTLGRLRWEVREALVRALRQTQPRAVTRLRHEIEPRPGA